VQRGLHRFAPGRGQRFGQAALAAPEAAALEGLDVALCSWAELTHVPAPALLSVAGAAGAPPPPARDAAAAAAAAGASGRLVGSAATARRARRRRRRRRTPRSAPCSCCSPSSTRRASPWHP